MQLQHDRFEVFYDGQCPLCRREINMVRRKDKHHRLLLTDISARDFEAASVGRSLDQLMREIHGRNSQGDWFVGVDVFREMYRRIGFERLSGLVDWPILRQLMQLGYRCFAHFRYRAAVARVRRETGAAFECGTACTPLPATKVEVRE
jgi:predicted DCC family thiol-disulfide oxidoreductase YuxK